MNKIEEKIYEILEEILNVNVEDYINIDLIEEGIIDSLMFIELISAFEDEFDINISPTQVPSNTWRKISDIKNLVIKRIEEENG